MFVLVALVIALDINHRGNLLLINVSDLSSVFSLFTKMSWKCHDIMRLLLPSWVSMKCPVKYLFGAVSTCMCLNPLNFACFFCLNGREECLRTVSKHLQSALLRQISWPPTTLAQHEKDINDYEKCNRAALTLLVGRRPGRITSQGSEKPTELRGPKSSRRCWHD